MSGESTLKRRRDNISSGESRNVKKKSDGGDADSMSSSDGSESQSWGTCQRLPPIPTTRRLRFVPCSWNRSSPGWIEKCIKTPDRYRYTSDEEGNVVDNAADGLELIAVSKRPTKLLPHATVVRTNLEPLEPEATFLKKIWCVKLMDDAHVPEIISGQLNVMKTHLKARYRLSDLFRAQRNDKMTSNLIKRIENGAPDEWKKTA